MPALDPAAYMRAYREQRRARGVCIDCGKASERYRCLSCRLDRCKPEAEPAYGEDAGTVPGLNGVHATT